MGTEYPLAEIFASVQGEGRYALTPMTFIRLAGCTVGKPYTPEARRVLNIQPYQERCTAWNGEGFACDTNYRMSKKYTAAQLMDCPEMYGALRVCITGGEPLMHNLDDLVWELVTRHIHIHVETSGTIKMPQKLLDYATWICVSPKQGFTRDALEQAHEIKVLVDKQSFNEEAFMEAFGQYLSKLSVSAINDEHAINPVNTQFCYELVQKHRQMRMSMQYHKILGVR